VRFFRVKIKARMLGEMALNVQGRTKPRAIPGSRGTQGKPSAGFFYTGGPGTPELYFEHQDRTGRNTANSCEVSSGQKAKKLPWMGNWSVCREIFLGRYKAGGLGFSLHGPIKNGGGQKNTRRASIAREGRSPTDSASRTR